MDIQTLIQAKFSGQLDETGEYVNLAVQAIAVIVGGIVLWRISSAMHAKKLRERSERRVFETRYSKNWKR